MAVPPAGVDVAHDGLGLGAIGAGIDDDAGAVLGQPERDRTADVAPGTGDERDFAGQ